jgi:hypothetical protein
MDTQSAAPGEAVAATPRHDEINGNECMLQRTSGPRHIGPILAEIFWRLVVKREAERAKVRP